jgi:hypothetical protein
MMSGVPSYEQQGVAMTCRSFEEYVRMFAINQDALSKGPILDVAAGASSFVAEASARGYKAIAADPMYKLDHELIMRRGTQEIEVSTAKLAKLQEHFDWTYYVDINNHQSIREASLSRFVQDYREAGQSQSRYIAAELPELPFPSDSFELVFCSHFLFLYGDQFDYPFHKRSILELIRVCRNGGKVLVYPLKTLGLVGYPQLAELLDELFAVGVAARVIPSGLPFIPGSTELLALTKM